jgi:long-chain acyl-CoA synthetase
MRALEWHASAPAPPRASVTREDLAEILFTSGATAEPKGVLIEHRNILANIVPVEQEVLKYRNYGRPFFPIRFLNLLPLSHMFGQAMATFIPPMLPGSVLFLSGQTPHDIVSKVRAHRISVIVCVPKILDLLRDYVTAAFPETRDVPPPGMSVIRRWWKYRRAHRALGWKFWAFVVGAAPLEPELEEFWKRLGFLVIQGYGLTETAPIVTLNHPFHTQKGTVGKPIAGVEVKIAEDGEVLVRGENVTPGYLGAASETFRNAWLHTGDVGSLDGSGRLRILGRKKEMIVTPDGLNVFPEDVERALNAQPGVVESAVVGRDRVHAVLVIEPGADPETAVRTANERLEDHQRVRGFSIWPGRELPRTEGTRKLKRSEVMDWLAFGSHATDRGTDVLESLIAQYGPQGEELALTSLERVELLMTLERRFGVTVDEAAYTEARTIGDLRRLIESPPATAPEPVALPTWNRSRWARALRRVNLPSWILPGARIFARVRAVGLDNLSAVDPPVIFASNHQSHLDVPSILMALPSKWRYRVAPAMSKEFFDAHFHPERHRSRSRFTNSLNYYLASLLFNAFPLPQREAGARQTLLYAGELESEGQCVLIFPEGRITDTGEIAPFQPGVGLLASRLRVPVVPVRLRGLDAVLHRTWKMARPGRVEVRFGKPLRLDGDDYAALAARVEEAVRQL